jgi:hypothetical protein
MLSASDGEEARGSVMGPDFAQCNSHKGCGPLLSENELCELIRDSGCTEPCEGHERRVHGLLTDLGTEPIT